MEPVHNSREIKVSTASVISLKAELSKRELSLKNLPKQQKTNPSKLKNMIIKNKGINDRIKKDSLSNNELSQLEQSWIQLNRKAKLYDEMQEQGEADPEEDQNLLVDFLMKNAKNDLKEELIETVDEFGRTRLIKKPDIEESRSKIQGFVKSSDNLFNEDISGPSNLHFDARKERRAMGVGFYQFSQDQQQRQAQLNELNILRVNTIDSKNKAMEEKMSREQRIKNRKELIAKKSAKRKEARENSKEVLDFLATI